MCRAFPIILKGSVSGGATYKSGCSQEHPDLKKIKKKKLYLIHIRNTLNHKIRNTLNHKIRNTLKLKKKLKIKKKFVTKPSPRQAQQITEVPTDS